MVWRDLLHADYFMVIVSFYNRSWKKLVNNMPQKSSIRLLDPSATSLISIKVFKVFQSAILIVFLSPNKAYFNVFGTAMIFFGTATSCVRFSS